MCKFDSQGMSLQDVISLGKNGSELNYHVFLDVCVLAGNPAIAGGRR